MIKNVVLAGGCFWCIEHDMRNAKGVTTVVSGYSGGEDMSPSYERHTGHREVVLVDFNDELTSYKKLLQFFIDHIDPTDATGQFADKGGSYKTAIFYGDEKEKIIAESVIKELNESHVYNTLATVEIIPRKPFYKAEEYHQDYADKNPSHYFAYRQGSGRGDFVERTCRIREEKNIIWSD